MYYHPGIIICVNKCPLQCTSSILKRPQFFVGHGSVIIWDIFEIRPKNYLVLSNYEHLAHEPQFHSECLITRGNTQMERYVGLQTVVTSLRGLEKKYEGNHEKITRTVAFPNILLFHFFCYTWVNYIGH